MWSANLRSNFYLKAKSAKIYLAIGVPILMKLKTKSTWVILKLSSRMNKKFIKLRRLRFLAKITGNVIGREFHVKEPLKSALQLLATSYCQVSVISLVSTFGSSTFFGVKNE